MAEVVSASRTIESAQVLHVNVGLARPLRSGGRTVLSAIGKRAVCGPVAVGRLGLAGDEQVDLSVHGGLDKAVYAYPVAHYGFWQAQRRAHGVGGDGEGLAPGFLGENLTITGLDEHQVWIGDEWHFPDLVLRVTAPREPCHKFNAVMGYAQAARDMVQRAACGFYLAVEQPGSVEAGQCLRLVPGSRGLRVADAFRAKRIKHLR